MCGGETDGENPQGKYRYRVDNLLKSELTAVFLGMAKEHPELKQQKPNRSHWETPLQSMR